MTVVLINGLEVIKPDVINFWDKQLLTTKDLADMININPRTLARSFQRNKIAYELNTHYIVLEGELLKRFKNSQSANRESIYTRSLYLWTQEGALLLLNSWAKNNSSVPLTALLDKVYDDLG